MHKNSVMVRISAGNTDRLNELVSFSAKPGMWFENWQEGTSTLVMSKINDDNTLSDIPCQFDAATRQLSWLTGNLRAEQSALYQIRSVDADDRIAERYCIEQKPAHLLINVDGSLFTRYNYLGVWKPYFWPVNGTCGTVVRGAGGGDHPHHTGLYLAYGGHGEGGSVNIWSDWDEPPYGPCGKMLHQRFVRMAEGPIYAEFVEEVTYVKGNGDIILEETRTAQAWYADNGARFLDLSFETTYPLDIGERIFMLVARIAPSMKIPNEGHVENSEGDVGRKEIQNKNARWCDFSGNVGNGVNGIALFDHPQNPEYPGLWGRIAVPSQITLVHHPPKELDHERLLLKFRVYVHEGTTEDAQIETRYQSYLSPVRMELVNAAPNVAKKNKASRPSAG